MTRPEHKVRFVYERLSNRIGLDINAPSDTMEALREYMALLKEAIPEIEALRDDRPRRRRGMRLADRAGFGVGEMG